MASTFLLHVPKTGGTCIDSLFAAAFDTGRLLCGPRRCPAVGHGSRLQHEGFQCLGGHAPAGCVDLRRFGRAIAVRRLPRRLCSRRPTPGSTVPPRERLRPPPGPNPACNP